jgi:pimeloyl-ACP methyl ester carboxylesterase
MILTRQLALNLIRAKFKLLSAISKKKAAQEAFKLFCTPISRHKKTLPGVFKEAEMLQLKTGENPVIGWRWNHPAATRVLILHGFESSVTNFEKYITSLIQKKYEVLAFDAPAHGRSSGKTITLPAYKNMIIDINKTFGPIHSYISHSFGGLAASLALEEMHPPENCKLVLIAPATETTTAIDNFFNILQLDNEVKSEFDKIILKKGGVSKDWYSIRRAMKNIRAKVLWIHDEEDDTTPISDVYKVREENFPNVEFYFTKGYGHSRIYREKTVINLIINFLSHEQNETHQAG